MAERAWHTKRKKIARKTPSLALHERGRELAAVAAETHSPAAGVCDAGVSGSDIGAADASGATTFSFERWRCTGGRRGVDALDARRMRWRRKTERPHDQATTRRSGPFRDGHSLARALSLCLSVCLSVCLLETRDRRSGRLTQTGQTARSGQTNGPRVATTPSSRPFSRAWDCLQFDCTVRYLGLLGGVCRP